jgi:hypothetical protein
MVDASSACVVTSGVLITCTNAVMPGQGTGLFMALSFEPSADTANPSGAPASVGAAYVSPAVSGVTVGGDAGTLSCADVSTLTIAGANFGRTTVDNAANKVLQLQLGDGAVGNWPFTMAAAAADGACAVTVADTENLIQCSGILSWRRHGTQRAALAGHLLIVRVPLLRAVSASQQRPRVPASHHHRVHRYAWRQLSSSELSAFTIAGTCLGAGSSSSLMDAFQHGDPEADGVTPYSITTSDARTGCTVTLNGTGTVITCTNGALYGADKICTVGCPWGRPLRRACGPLRALMARPRHTHNPPSPAPHLSAATRRETRTATRAS